ncbi:hypothetical protein, partial [Yoonia sp.]|uniref:hypothetical protein n=1 Tax=Yoonia sp. TaxID=2212373 RepID=UPI002DFF7058|nr:hypothetical protein [Yoonia sp.]
PDARQDGWRAGMEAAAKVALNASLANGESPLQLVGDEARGFAMGISGAHAAIRALAEKGPTNE